MKKGFTLIELLVVIAIIGILAAIIIANLGDARGRAKNASAIESLTSLRGVAELYSLDNGDYRKSTTPVDFAGSVCADPSISKILNSINTDLGGTTPVGSVSAGTRVICVVNASGSSYRMVMIPIGSTSSSGDKFCIDSSGFSGKIPNLGIGGNVHGAAVTGLQSCL